MRNNLNGTAVEDSLIEPEKMAKIRRTYSGDKLIDALAEVEDDGIKINAWFDDEDEYENNKTKIKSKLHKSLNAKDMETFTNKWRDHEEIGVSPYFGTTAFDVTSVGVAMTEAEIHNRTMKERYFSKMEKGSMRSSILGMTCAAIGSGVLTFPQVFK